MVSLLTTCCTVMFCNSLLYVLGNQLLNGETVQLVCMLSMTKGQMFSGMIVDFVLVCIKNVHVNFCFLGLRILQI